MAAVDYFNRDPVVVASTIRSATISSNELSTRLPHRMSSPRLVGGPLMRFCLISATPSLRRGEPRND
jgi:hypothetical protein